MHHDILETVVGAIFLGILAQVLAGRYKLPAILPLLLFGMAAGPFGLKLVDPSALGHGLEVIIHLGVAVILFEGGLSLNPQHLRQVSKPVRNLLTLGTVVTGVGAASLAYLLIDISWGTAALFGAIVTVTGPTVIAPLLRHMVAPKKVRTILVSEGLMIDAIGAVLAYLVLLWTERSGLDLRSLVTDLLALGATGAVLGFAAGSLAVLVVRYRHMSDELRNLVILALLLGGYLIAESQASQSGILASVVMGLTVSGSKTTNLSELKSFKGQLTVLLISVLFILLSGQLDLSAVYHLGVEGLLVVAGLIFLIRPLSVFLSIPPRHLDLKQRILLALTAPRGIVAAAVASLSAIQLRAAGKSDDAAALEGLVYLVIVVTCTWATIMAGLLPRWLGYVGDPTRRRVILVGASPLASALARSFGAEGWTPVVVDSVPSKLEPFRNEKISAISGDAREASTYELASVERDSHVLALTPNDELNLLVAELVREEFSVEHPVVVLQNPSAEFGQLRRAWVDPLSHGQFDLRRWNLLLEADEASVETVELDDAVKQQDFMTMLRESPEDMVLICDWTRGRPSFEQVGSHPDEISRATVLCTADVLPGLDLLAVAEEAEVPAPPADPKSPALK